MDYNFKKVMCGVVTLILLFACHSVGYSQQVSRTVNYNALFQPFGEGIHKEYLLPAEVDPEKHLQIRTNLDLTPEDLTIHVNGTLVFDQGNGTLQIRGEDGVLRSEGGISFAGVISIAFELPKIPFAIDEPIPIKIELPFSISNFLSEGILKKLPIPINVLDTWTVSESFESLLFTGDPIEVRGGIRDMLRVELQVEHIVEMIIRAVTASAGVPLPGIAIDILGDAFEIALGNAGISYNLGFLSTATLTGKSITVNGQSITSENQSIRAPGLDLSQSHYTVNSSYEEQFTYQLDYVASSDVWLEFNPLGIPVWSYPKTVIAEFPTPIIPKQEIDLHFTSEQTTFPIVHAEVAEPPIAVNTIPTQNLTLPGPARPVEVASYFSSESALIYEAESSPRGIVSTSVSGSRVTITPEGEGSVSVIVTAFDRDDRSLSAVQTIPVTVRPNRATIVRPPSDPTFTEPTTTNPVVKGLDDGVEIIVQNTGNIGLNIRSNPWVADNNKIGNVRDGATGTITDGPERNGGFKWWKIDWDDRHPEGWSVEADGGSQLLFPRPADLEIRRFRVSEDEVEPGETFTVYATVQNNGPGESPATDIFFYYQKSDEDTPRVAGSGELRVRSLRERRSDTVSLRVEAPMIPGDYEYGAILPPDIPDDYDEELVDPTRRIRLNNIAHEDVEVTSAPDLIVESISANRSTVDPGERFRLEAVVRNQGIGAPARNATLRYYRSRDANITKNDTDVGDDTVTRRNLDTNGTDEESVSLTAPTEPGIYYYGACVDLRGESNTRNNCSAAVAITVRETGPPDLVVSTPTLSLNTLAPGQSFTLTTTVRNQGTDPAPATTLRAYVSPNTNISDVDTEVGSVSIGALASGATQTVQINVEAPVATGISYYGVCVDPASNEDNTVNNCSTGVALTVENRAPVATDTFSPQILIIGTAAVLDMARYFSDPNGDVLTYTVSSSAVGTVAVEMSGLSDSYLKMTPVAVGTATVTIAATDPNDLSFTQTFSATVNPLPNRAPAAVNTIPDQTLMASGESGILDVSTSFYDLDGDTLRYTVSSDNTGVVSVNISGTQVTLIPEAEGSASVTVTASDGELTATQMLSVTVVAAPTENEAPVAVGVIPPQSLTIDGEAATVDLSAYFSDVNDDTLTYAAWPDDKSVVKLQRTGTLLTITPKAAGQATVTVRATDPEGLQAVQRISVSVNTIEIDGEPPSEPDIEIATEVPDLVVESIRAGKTEMEPGAVFRVDAVIRNQGTVPSAKAQVRFYRSTDATITPADTQMKTADLPAIAVDATRNKWIRLTAPNTAGVYYYGVCIEGVADESDTENNCSTAVKITVETLPDKPPTVEKPKPVPETRVEKPKPVPETGVDPLPADSLAEQVFQRYGQTLRRRDVKAVLPNVLTALKEPDIQKLLVPATIKAVIEKPDLLKQMVPTISDEFIVLLKTDAEIKRLLSDPQVQTLLQTPAAIDALAKLLGIRVAPTTTPGGTVAFRDPNLASKVREALNLPAGAAIPKAKLATLTHLDASVYGAAGETEAELEKRRIRHLTGLEHATQLKILLLVNHQVSDFTPLAGLKRLETLDFFSNFPLTDINPLKGLTNLRKLFLDGAGSRSPRDLTPLAGLKKLEDLALHSMALDDNAFTPLAPLLAGLPKLSQLYLAYNRISNANLLAGLTGLRNLDLRYNQIRDVRPLERLVNLGTLHIKGNPIEDLAPLRRLKAKNPNLWIDIDINAPAAPAAPVSPDETALLPNYPNPFNPETWIPYQLAKDADVTVTIYDVRGGVVRRLALGHQAAGFYYGRGRAAYWDGRNALGEKVASGLYFYTFTAGDFTATQKLLIRK